MVRKASLIGIFLVVWLAFPILTRATYAGQNGPFLGEPPNFEALSGADGLAHPFVFDILQDHQGFMWFATAEGLNRYDGYEFTTYTIDPVNPNSLSDGYVTAIREDQAGNLWLGTGNGGLNKFDLQTETFTRYRHDAQNPNSLSDNRIPYGALYIAPDGAVWIGTENGLNKFDPQTETFTQYHHHTDVSNSLSNDHILAIAAASLDGETDALWIGTEDGLNKFDPIQETWTHYRYDAQDPHSLSNNTVRAIYVPPKATDGAPVVWIGTAGGLNKFDGENNTFTRYQHDETVADSLSHNNIYDISLVGDGTLWIATQGGGLNRFDPVSETFTHYPHDPNNPQSLSSDILSRVYRDRAGAFWIGTHGGGIAKLDPQNQKFRLYQHQANVPGSLGPGGIFNIVVDEQGIVWLGSGNGLNRFDPTTDTFTRYQHDDNDPTSLSHNFVHNVYVDSQGVFWVGTWGGGLNIFDPDTETFSLFSHPDLIIDRVNDLYEDHTGTLWIGTFRYGVYGLDATRTTLVNYRQDEHDPYSLSHNEVMSFYEDRQGTLWVGTLSGLNAFDREQGRFIRYKHDEQDPASLSNNHAKRMYEDSQGNLWVTTDLGLNKFDRSTQQFTIYLAKDGLPHNRVNSIIEDDQGFLWLGTAKGIARFDPRTATFKNYDLRDGLQDNLFFLHASAKSDSGELYFGGPNGLNVFRPDALTDNPFVPPVVLTGFQLFNGSAGPAQDAALSGHIDTLEPLVLSPEQSVFGFEFAALNYTNPDKNQYAYRMEGFEQEWTYTDSAHRFARYTNLDPGDYTFRVKAANNDGIWNEQGTSLQITILPFWWETWWFYTLCVLGVLGVFGLVYWNKASQVRTERALTRLAQENETKYRILFESFPLGITVSDPSGKILETNRIAEDILGVDQETHEQRSLDGQEWRIIRPDGTLMPSEEYASVRALQENQIITHQEMGIVKSQGAVTWLDVTAAPLPLENYGVVITYSDITEHKQAEHILETERSKLFTALNLIPGIVYLQARDYSIPFANERFIAAFGAPQGRPCYTVIHGIDTPCEACPTFQVFDTHASVIWEWTGGADQHTHIVYDEPFPGLGGEEPMVLEMLIDITERKQAEERLKSTLQDKEILLRELYHRTKNTLQVIRSLLLLQADRMSENEQVQRLVHDMENRIMTIALVHQKLYQSQDLSRIDMAEYVQELAYLILRSFSTIAGNIKLTFAVEEMCLLLDTAIPCGLILNELLSNAVKYAFPDHQAGEITIKLFRNDRELLELHVADNGVGVPPDFDFRQQESMGLQTVIGLAEHQMQGTIQFAGEHGVTWVITFPDTLYTERV